MKWSQINDRLSIPIEIDLWLKSELNSIFRKHILKMQLNSFLIIKIMKVFNEKLIELFAIFSTNLIIRNICFRRFIAPHIRRVIELT